MSNITKLRTPQEPCPLAIGARVALRGGGVVMTVTDQFEPIPPTMRWMVECCWQNEVGDACTESYPADALYEPRMGNMEEGRALPV